MKFEDYMEISETGEESWGFGRISGKAGVEGIRRGARVKMGKLSRGEERPGETYQRESGKVGDTRGKRRLGKTKLGGPRSKVILETEAQ